MQFVPENVAAFLQVFEERKSFIRSFEGCHHLELWQDANDASIFFTYSHWVDEQALEHYRKSPLFKETWQLTKALFAEKAQAWTVVQHSVLS